MHTVAVGIPAFREVLADAQADHTYLTITTVCRREHNWVGSRTIGQPANEAKVEAQLQRQEGMLRPKAQLRPPKAWL